MSVWWALNPKIKSLLTFLQSLRVPLIGCDTRGSSIALGHTRALGRKLPTLVWSCVGGLDCDDLAIAALGGVTVLRLVKNVASRVFLSLGNSICLTFRRCYTKVNVTPPEQQLSDISSECHLASLITNGTTAMNCSRKTRHLRLPLEPLHMYKKQFKHGGCLTFSGPQYYQKLSTLLSWTSNLYSFIFAVSNYPSTLLPFAQFLILLARPGHLSSNDLTVSSMLCSNPMKLFTPRALCALVALILLFPAG